jgi:hypothetical protein
LGEHTLQNGNTGRRVGAANFSLRMQKRFAYSTSRANVSLIACELVGHSPDQRSARRGRQG